MNLYSAIERKFATFAGISKGPFLLIMLSLSLFSFLNLAYIRNQTDFSPTMILHKEIADDCFPSALCDRKGNIHVVWQSDRNGNWDIFYLHSDNGLLGKEFVCVTESREDDLFPSLAEDEKGNILIVWIRNNAEGSSILCKVIGSENDTDNKEKILIPADGIDRRSPCLISIDQQNMLLAWISKKEKDQEIEYVILNEHSTGREKPVTRTENAKRVTSGKTMSGQIFLLWDSMHLGENHLYMSFFDERDLYFRKYRNLNSENDLPISGSSPFLLIRQEEPCVLFFLNEDDIYTSTERKNSGESEYLIFTVPKPFSVTGAYESSPSAIENKNGEVYLFWASDFARDDEICFYESSNIIDFQTGDVQYGKGSTSIGEKKDKFIRNLSRDPSQNNSSPDGYFCNDISFCVAVVDGELWVVWDSYDWDLSEPNNRRQIKYAKTKNDSWSLPSTIIDTSKSKKLGRDDRCPAITQTGDGTIWLFWHSDRFKTGQDDNFDICFIKSEDGGSSWIWDDQDNSDPFRLTKTSARDLFPSVSSIGKEIFVVWQSDVRLGNFDILFSKFDGEEWLPEEFVSYEDFPEEYPNIASYGWSFGKIEKNEIVVTWESFKGDSFLAEYRYMEPNSEVTQFESPSTMSISFPSVSFVSRDKIFGKEPWFGFQYYYILGNAANIRCKKGDGSLIQVTDDFSLNERSRIIEFEDRIWFFWDSSGGGNGRGIYYRYMYTKEIPIWLSTFMVVLAIVWFFFLLFSGSENVRRIVKELYEPIRQFFLEHDKLTGGLKFIVFAVITYMIGRLLSYLI
jgi:hypothetical protein